MKKYSHVFRIFSVTGAIFLGLWIFQSVMAPDSFGKYGRYRGDHLLEASSFPPLHRGDDYCLNCHEKEWDMADAKHGGIPCENCHFLAKPHAIVAPKGTGEEETGKREGMAKYSKVEVMPIDATGEPCRQCHIFLPSRPAGFPQIKNPEAHIKDGWKKRMGAPDVTVSCSRCHNSHFPKAFAKVNI